MLGRIARAKTWMFQRIVELRNTELVRDDRGASVIETVIIAAALAALALGAMATISMLVNSKVSSINL